MYTLRLLGTASLEGAHGLVTGRAAQGRRLALLALLALARGRPLSRDKLVALLWPDASPDRARPQLSDTLYILRSSLGDDVIQATGDVLVLEPRVLDSDVAHFERLLAEGRPEPAVALYRGPLLDGFHLADSVEFENWLDGERAGLARQYEEALEALAVAAEAGGDTQAAVGWWRRRAAHEPHSGRVALRLMAALEAAGDRAGAIRHARIHATLLREEFDAEPDAEVQAFADRLRREPPAAVVAPVQPTSGPSAHAPAPTTRAEPTPSTLPPVQAQPSSPPARARLARFRRHRLIAAGLVLVLLGALAFAQRVRRDAAPSTARSIAVLPFVNMSPDPANTYFSDGLSEQIILALSRIDGLRVAARTSSFALRDRALDVRAIADTLDVQAVLEWSVLVDGERLRVIAQLIDARTGYHIWSEQYDGELRDALDLQDRLAHAIADALHLRLAASDTHVDGAPVPSLEAYDLYLRGLYLRNTLTADALREADRYFDRALEQEPRFALALAAKASVIAAAAYFRYTDRDSVVAELRVITARALELDPRIGEAHAALGILRLFYDWDWSGAHASLRRAIELNPNDAHAWHHLANYHAAMGESADAIVARERAVQLDPLNARSRIVLSRDYLLAGDLERAMEQARRAAQLDPQNPLLLGLGPGLPAGSADVLLHSGREPEAVEEYLRLATLRRATASELEAMRAGYARAGITGFWQAWLALDLRQSGASPDPFRMATTYLGAGDTTAALDWLDRAFAERNPGLIYLQRYSTLSSMRDHPRVQRIARAMKLPARS